MSEHLNRIQIADNSTILILVDIMAKNILQNFRKYNFMVTAITWQHSLDFLTGVIMDVIVFRVPYSLGLYNPPG